MVAIMYYILNRSQGRAIANFDKDSFHSEGAA